MKHELVLLQGKVSLLCLFTLSLSSLSQVLINETRAVPTGEVAVGIQPVQHMASSELKDLIVPTPILGTVDGEECTS